MITALQSPAPYVKHTRDAGCSLYECGVLLATPAPYKLQPRPGGYSIPKLGRCVLTIRSSYMNQYSRRTLPFNQCDMHCLIGSFSQMAGTSESGNQQLHVYM